MKTISKLLLAVIAISTLLTSCKKDNEKKDAQIHFVFSYNIDGEALEFDTIKYVNAFGNTYGVSTLKYFVSGFTLTKTDGTKVIIDEVYYIEKSDGASITFTPEILIPGGDYNSFSFIFGLDEEHNITGEFPNPPENLMEWPLPMGGGYHYMKLEGKFDSVSTIKNFQAHTGRLMQIPHFIEETFPEFSLSVDGGDKTFNINMNINNWWVQPNTLDLNNISGIMGNEDVQVELQQNGGDVFALSIE